MRLAFAVNHAEADRAFRAAQQFDPDRAMRYWGEALVLVLVLVLGANINAPMFPDAVAPADSAAARQVALSARAFLNDDTIQVLFAKSLTDLSPWNYLAAGGSQPGKRTTGMVGAPERVLERNPAHPGAIRGYLHVMEASIQTGKALPHARRPARFIPGAGHLVHMPPHIYYRLGLYKEALQSNPRAIEVDGRVFNRKGAASDRRREIDAIERSADFKPLADWGVPARQIVQTAHAVANDRLADALNDLPAAIKSYQEAVAIQDGLPYTEPPYWYYPVRQSLGATLLRAGRLDEAEDVLRTSLARTPGNGWASGLMAVYRERGDRAALAAARKRFATTRLGTPQAPALSAL